MTQTLDNTAFVAQVTSAFEAANKDFARAYYLFATARLEETYNSKAIYDRYPMLQDEATFQRLKSLYDADPQNETIKRLFVETLGTYISNHLAEASDALTNLKNTLQIAVDGLGLTRADGTPMETVLYEDTPELFKKIDNKDSRESLYQRVSSAYTQTVTPRFIDLFNAENQLFADLGYPDLVAFYSQSSGHNLLGLGHIAKTLLEQTHEAYMTEMGSFYTQRTGLPFSEASRADIMYVFNGFGAGLEDINTHFGAAQMLPLAKQTFDGMGLRFSDISAVVDFANKADYEACVNDPTRPSRILLDISRREGKRSRAYVYPAQAPSEIYLSVKPEGGLDDYSAFFHESGHAHHFAYVSPKLSYPLALMGNNTTTESYAYLFQNLLLNAHWLVHQAGLAPQQAALLIRKHALHDLYMLRRYASKMQFELALFDGEGLVGKPQTYASLLTNGTGFTYDADGWSRDVDAGFYVADYFTAWTLEAQLRRYLETHFGTSTNQGEDWYQNPKAGQFLQDLWQEGNICQNRLASLLGASSPNDTRDFLTLMTRNLTR